jgi:hypothetical protein
VAGTQTKKARARLSPNRNILNASTPRPLRLAARELHDENHVVPFVYIVLLRR